jgi:iron complex transport system permease protein
MTHFNPGRSFLMDGFIQKRRTFFFLTVGLGTAALVSMLLAVSFGTVKISPETAYQIILYKMFNLNIGDAIEQISPSHMDIIWQLRFPRVLMAAIVGAGLAVCGTVMQATVQNPLAEPYILGISAGASFGATFAILLGITGLSGIGTPVGAFTGALAASLLVMLLSGIGGQLSTVRMVLSGTISNALFLSLSNCIIYVANNAEGIRSVTFWMMGSLAAAKWSNLLLPALGVILCCIFFLSQHRILNTLLLGEEAAITLGVDLNKIRRKYLIISALITGLIVSSCGVISFVGLIIPHIVRGLVGCDHRRLIPSTMLVGSIFLTWADLLARISLKSGELPIGIITALIGAPFFMYILFKQSYGFGSK